eukprot:6713714-Prymnesium_polylepis.1
MPESPFDACQRSTSVGGLGVGELGADDLALWHHELEEVVHDVVWLGGVHLEEQVRVEGDDARPHLVADHAQQVHVAELLHRPPADEAGNGAHLVDDDHVKALVLHAVQRLEATEHELSRVEVDVLIHVQRRRHREAAGAQLSGEPLLLPSGVRGVQPVGRQQQEAGGRVVVRLGGGPLDGGPLEVADHRRLAAPHLGNGGEHVAG